MADWDNAPCMPESFRRAVRSFFSGAIIYAGHYTAQSATQLLDSGLGDLFAFGRTLWPTRIYQPESRTIGC